MIDRGDIRQAIDYCSNVSGASTAGRWLWSFNYIKWQPDCKIQRSGRNGQRDWCMSRVTAIMPLVICIIVCVSWAVNHYRDNAVPTKWRDKNTELKLANATITDMQMRQRDVAALDAKYTKELAMLKLKMMLCVMMLPLVLVGCTSKQSVSRCVKPPPPPAWIIQPPPLYTLADAERDVYPQRGWSLCKKPLEGTRSILMSSADTVAHRWATHAIIVSNTRFSGV